MARKPRIEDDQAKWRSAHSFADVCELAAQYIEGRIHYFPTYGGPIDSETRPLVPMLAELNRAGFLTDFSQPGEPLDEQGFAQRASVTGFAMEDVAKRIACLTLATDLLVVTAPAVDNRGAMVPVTLDEFRAHTWSGFLHGEETLDQFVVECGLGAMTEMKLLAWSVCVVDMRWGRKDYLWRELVGAVKGTSRHLRRFVPEPSPDVQPDRDFVY